MLLFSNLSRGNAESHYPHRSSIGQGLTPELNWLSSNDHLEFSGKSSDEDEKMDWGKKAIGGDGVHDGTSQLASQHTLIIT